MRTCSAALIAEMQKVANTPCVSVAFTPYGGGSTITFGSNDSPSRVYRAVEREAPWGSVLVVELKNHDNYFKTLDWSNYKVVVKFGYVIGDTPTYPTEDFPAYYVWRQTNVSLMGEPGLLTRFVCADILTRAADSKIISGAGVVLTGYINPTATDEFNAYQETVTGATSGATGKIGLIDSNYVQLYSVTGTFQTGETVSSAHFSMQVSAVTDMGEGGGNSGYTGVSITSAVQSLLKSVVAATTVSTSAPGSDDDDSNCASQPKLSTALGDGVLVTVQALVYMTKCGLLWRGTAGYLKYIDNSAASVRTYGSDYGFLEYDFDRAVEVPNRIFVVNAVPCVDYDPQVATASVTPTITDIIVDPTASDAATALKRANAALARASADCYVGTMKVPCFDPGVELYDKVSTYDARADAQETSGMIGEIQRTWMEGDGSMELVLGGVRTAANMPSGVDFPGPIDTRVTEYKPPSGPSGSLDIITQTTLREGMQPYVVNITWDSTAVDNVGYAFGSPSVQFADGKTLTLSSCSGGTATDYTLGNSNEYYLYFDLDHSPSTEMQVTQTFTDTVGRRKGLLAVALKGDANSSKAMILPLNGKSPVLSAVMLYADIIRSTHIAARQITFDKMYGVPTTLMDGYYSSFEVWTTSPGVPDGWFFESGTATQWFACTSNPKHGTIYAGVGGNSAIQSILWYDPIYVDENDIITITTWVAYDNGADGTVGFGYKPYSKAGADLGNQVATIGHSAITTGTWYQRTLTAKCPAGTAYIRPILYILANNTTGYWYFDDVRCDRSAVIIMHGTVGAQRVQIDGDGVYGYNSSNVAQFYLRASDGKAMCGAGSVVLDASGVTIKGQYLIFKHTDDTIMGYMLGNSTGISINAGASNTILMTALDVSINADLKFATSGRMFMKRYNQATEPSLADGEMAMWRDTDNGKTYLVYNDADSGQNLVELL